MLATDIAIQASGQDVLALLPVLLLGVGGVVLLVLDAFAAPRVPSAWITPVLLALAAWFQVHQPAETTHYFADFWIVDGTRTRFHLLFLAIAFLTWCCSGRYAREGRPFRSEYHALILFAGAGMMLMAGAGHFLTAFLGLEVLSLSLYALTAWRRERRPSVEAALKYFLLGTFAAAILLYGAALNYAADARSLFLFGTPAPGDPAGLQQVGLLLILAALLFKVSAAPFHMWTPDVYEAAPTPVTALMSTGTKAAAFALVIVLAPRFAPASLGPIVAVSVLTMLVGNGGALVQRNVKRLLAYSSIAHAGYLLLGVAAMVHAPQHANALTSALVFYLVAYAFTNLLAFGALSHLESRTGRELELGDLAGLGRRYPLASAGLALAAFSLAGVPPTAGFFGKYYLFAAVIRADLLALALTGILLSVVSLGYYLRLVSALYMDEEGAEAPNPQLALQFPPDVSWGYGAGRTVEATGLWITALAVFGLSLVPGLLGAFFGA